MIEVTTMPKNDNPYPPEACPGCTVCGVSRGGNSDDHHWLEDFDSETEEPVWACKHCTAQKPYE